MSDDAEVQRHKEAWVGFTRFLTWGTIAVIVILAGMAIFLTP